MENRLTTTMKKLLFNNIVWISFAAVMTISARGEETIKVRVHDSKNRGVQSIVFLSNTNRQVRFGKTNRAGYLSREYSCELGDVLTAYPLDRGNYFASEGEDCSKNSILHVVSRATPYGNAEAIHVRTLKRMENGKGVTYKIMARGVLQTDAATVKLRTASAAGFRTDCDVHIIPTSYIQVYKVDSKGMWHSISNTEKRVEEIIETSYFEGLDCEEASAKILKVRNKLATKLPGQLKRNAEGFELGF